MNLTDRMSELVVVLALLAGLTTIAQGQGAGRGQRPPAVISPEIQADRHVTFRILAPQADSVRLNAGDIPGVGSGVMTKTDAGVWEITLGPIDPGAYRYTFNVNGVTVVDPRSPSVSESNDNVWSVVYVPGSDFMDTRNVPHGAVSSVTYYSTALGRHRRMHVYTPPGYESGKGKFPVFYLLHGASDSDDSWISEGRASFILDNLIAAGKAKPMIVALPAGHTRNSSSGPAPARAGAPTDEFVADFTTDIMPYIEKHYRTINDRAHRAIAGLSMGGSQTLNIAIPHLDSFAYVGVYSSGLFGIFGPQRPGAPGAATPISPFPWEEQHRASLDNAALKKGLKLFWFRTGKEDFLLTTSQATVAMFKKHGFNVEFAESEGGHTWINWRNYLNEFAPQLFR